MELITTLSVIVLLSCLSAWKIVSCIHSASVQFEKVRWMSAVLASCVFLLCTECFKADMSAGTVVSGLLMALLAVMSNSFALFPPKTAKIISIMSIIAEVLSGVLNILCECISVPVLTALPSICIIVIPGLISATYIYGILAHLMNLKVVMRMGSVWTTICVCVDSIYVIMLLVMTLIFHVTGACMIFLVFLAALLGAVFCRVADSTAFIFLREQERKIVETMKISHLDSTSEGPGIEILYKNLYEKILRYFEDDAPYLNNSLTINDIVSVVFSNKLYISKAISRYTGRNFCQFVNYYRVTYAVELFRKNPNMKIVEMATCSGFNSSVSFSMAFRLFMGEKPGDWCRKERSRLGKNKK